MKKIVSIVLVGFSIGLGLIQSSNGQSQTTEFTGTLKKIKESGTIVLGVRESSIPFSYLDNNQKSIGYSIDLCLKVVDSLKKQLQLPNLKVETNPVTSQTRIPLMASGVIDLECGSTTNTKERQKQVAFSVAHYISSVRMAVKANSNIKTLDDLDGKPVVTTSGTTSDSLIKQNERGKKINVVNLYGKDHAESFLILETGRASAFVMDDVLLAGLIANSKKPDDFQIVGAPLSVEPYGLMLRKDDPAFKKVVDDTLKSVFKSGEVNRLYTKWFLRPIPPRGIKLNLPLGDALKSAFQKPSDQGKQ